MTPFDSLPQLLGNATEALFYIFLIIVGFCVLSGQWWIMLYVMAAVALFCVALAYAMYLEWNVQEYLEEQRKKEAKKKI